jgi:hypothetical protein
MNSDKDLITAEDLLREVRNDPAHFKRRRDEQLQVEERQKRYFDAAEPLLRELRDAGHDVERVIELGRDGRSYQDVAPTLIAWLNRTSERTLLDEIVRALIEPVGGDAAVRALTTLFNRLPSTEESGLKWTVATAIAANASPASHDDIAALIRDRRHGRAREQLMSALPRIATPAAVALARDALDDPELTGFAIEALRQMGASETARDIEPFANHPSQWIRKEAKQALRSFEGPDGR